MDFAIQATADEDFDLQALGATAGLVYRTRTSENSVVGFNAYLEAIRPSATSETFGLVSFGAEYDYRMPDQRGFWQLGGNVYLPFDDYTDVAEYGMLGAAPRQGADVFASVGRGFDGYTVRGTLAGFSYAETDTARALTGYRASAEVEWKRGLPENMTLTGSLGVRDDNRIGVDPALVAGLEATWQFGQPTCDITRDCALIREGDERPRVDCNESVIPGNQGGSKVKGKVAPVTVAATPPVTGRTVNRPRRHLGYGTPPTPIEYKDASITLVKRTKGGDGTFRFTSSVVALNTALTTASGQASTGPTRVNAGRYTITEGALKTGWSLTSARCAGAVDTDVDLTARTVTVEAIPGAKITCTFVNTFSSGDTTDGDDDTQEPEPPVEPEEELAKLTIVKRTVGSELEIVPMEFSITGAEAFDETLYVPAGTEYTDNQSVSGQVHELDPGSYTITEAASELPWRLTDISCSDGSTVDISAATAQVELASGDDVTCTFTNTLITGRISLRNIIISDDLYPGQVIPGNTLTFESTEPKLNGLTATYPDGWVVDQIIDNGPIILPVGRTYTIDLLMEYIPYGYDNNRPGSLPSPVGGINTMRQSGTFDPATNTFTPIPPIACVGGGANTDVDVPANTDYQYVPPLP